LNKLDGTGKKEPRPNPDEELAKDWKGGRLSVCQPAAPFGL